MASGGKTSLGMKSVKAGIDKNPGVTRADIIAAATKQAKKGIKVTKKAQKGYSAKKNEAAFVEGLEYMKKKNATKATPKNVGKAAGNLMKKGGKVTKKSGGMKKCRGGCW